MTPPRLVPLLDQYDHATERLLARLIGPVIDSGDGADVEVPPLTDAEYLWEPAPGAWSVRRQLDGPGPGATVLVGAGEWGRDGGRPHPYPPPVTTIAWRMHHLTEMLAGRADWTVGSHSFDEDEMVVRNDAASAIARSPCCAISIGQRTPEPAAISGRGAQVVTLDASTSAGLISGGCARSRSAFSMSAAAIGPLRCVWRSASPGKASTIQNLSLIHI